jgi:hypothetical protein
MLRWTILVKNNTEERHRGVGIRKFSGFLMGGGVGRGKISGWSSSESPDKIRIRSGKKFPEAINF